VAGRDGEVIASADTYERLSDQLERMAVEWDGSSSSTSSRLTSSVSIELPLPRLPTPFGPLSDPKVPIAVGTLMGDRMYRLRIDTGVEVSVTPRHLAQQEGLDWQALPAVQAVGIERCSV
jgi:hypothetical protein